MRPTRCGLVCGSGLAARQCRQAQHERSRGTWLPSPPRGRWTCRVLVSVVGRVDVVGQCGSEFCQVGVRTYLRSPINDQRSSTSSA
eukprot:scaffold41312_cov54-Phaeocystis_antarctica.AAC.1